MTKAISLKQLQRITLEHQGLIKTHTFGKGKKAVLSAIEHLGYVQIDTLSVVERAHHHTLYTRIPDYKKEYLAQLTEEREIFEYWLHAASFLPMKDFRYVLPQMREYREGKSHYYKMLTKKHLTMFTIQFEQKDHKKHVILNLLIKSQVAGGIGNLQKWR